jgi:hypothetical protein
VHPNVLTNLQPGDERLVFGALVALLMVLTVWQ